MRHAGIVRLSALAGLLLASALPLPASAGLFDDEEARRQIIDLRNQIERTGQQLKDTREQANARIDKLEPALKAQIDLANQIEGLRAELAKLRGQLEVLSNDMDATQKRQKDFYVDLDSRLRRLEAKAAEAPKPVVEEAPKVDPAAITREYEAALNLFKQAKYKESLGSFETFLKAHPGDALAPSAQYWIGNSHYALRDCKKAIDAQNVVIKQWPDSPKVPDAWLAIATCQQDLGDAKAARKSLDTIVGKFPDSPAAAKARQRLKKK